MSNLKKDKESKRDEFLSKRNSLSEQEALTKSEFIREKIEEIPEFQRNETLSIYVAKQEEREVETRGMIKSWLGEKEILVPYVVGENLDLCPIQNFKSDMCRGTFGVMEPKEEVRCPVSVDKVNVIFVPGVAFDAKGNRLGYGGGYYDRLLQELPNETAFVGLAYDFQITDHVPNGEGDVPMDKIVTEERLIEAKE